MGLKPTIGYIACPTCGFPDMEVKLDKREFAFAYCPDCDQQLFTHKQRKSDQLLARMRKVGEVKPPEPEQGDAEKAGKRQRGEFLL